MHIQISICTAFTLDNPTTVTPLTGTIRRVSTEVINVSACRTCITTGYRYLAKLCTTDSSNLKLSKLVVQLH